MNADEEYVRARWKRVIVCDGSYRHYAKGTILLNWANHQFYEFNDCSAARAFTKQREREIAEVEEEIALVANVETTTAAFIASIYVAKHIKQDASSPSSKLV